MVVAVSWALRPYPRWWRLSLVAAGWVFYAWWDWRLVALLAGFILVNHLVAGAMENRPRRQRAWLAFGIGVDLAVLAIFKYYGFFATTLLDVLSGSGLQPTVPLFEVLFPIGISFYTLEGIAYLVEIRRGITRRMPLLDLAVYLGFFPKLVSGPITRASEFAPQLSEPASVADLDTPGALWLIGRGLFKKVVIASYLSQAITEGVFSTPSQYSALEVVAGIYAYAAQIYIDFSAYTDMAIGIGMLLGFRLPDNFRSPYTADSFHEFWNRWHISLSRWLRDFLFQPLALRWGSHRGGRLAVLVVVMLLAGLWHGAAWTFVAWGGIHGLALAGERWMRERRRAHGLPRPSDTTRRRIRARLVTFHVVVLAWVFFRAESFDAAWGVLRRLTDIGPAPAVTPLLLTVVVTVFAFQFIPENWSARVGDAFRRLGPIAQTAALGTLLLVVDTLGPEGVAPFIYTRF